MNVRVYDAIVDAIKLNWPPSEREFYEPRRALAEHFAGFLEKADPTFQRNLFIEDCLRGTKR